MAVPSRRPVACCTHEQAIRQFHPPTSCAGMQWAKGRSIDRSIADLLEQRLTGSLIGELDHQNARTRRGLFTLQRYRS